MRYKESLSSKTCMVNSFVQGRDRTLSDVLTFICMRFDVHCMRFKIMARSAVRSWTYWQLTGKCGLGAGKIECDERTTPHPCGKVLKERALIQTWRSKSVGWKNGNGHNYRSPAMIFFGFGSSSWRSSSSSVQCRSNVPLETRPRGRGVRKVKTNRGKLLITWARFLSLRHDARICECSHQQTGEGTCLSDY
jgi:hypothetical protein